MQIITNIEQGSEEWHALRKTKITATDASVIMGVNPWKNKSQLYKEKMSSEINSFINERMQRGIDLEPVARDLFNIEHNTDMKPVIAVNDWAMASLDGYDELTKQIIEIKCPGEKDHALALDEKIPEYYYPQLQFQMYVCECPYVYYYSFDGTSGIAVHVKRDDKYIEKMTNECLKFYNDMQLGVPPENEKTYIEREDEDWQQAAQEWMEANSYMKLLVEQEQVLREKLISLSDGNNCKGFGISICNVSRKGNIDYAKIPQLKDVDLELYRKPATSSWRIST